MRFDTWAEFLEHQRRQPYMRQISEIVTAERRLADLPQPRRRPPAGVYPALEDVFRFTETPLRDVKVVILGQDPYHQPGQADGLAFSVREGVALPPSLRNILCELNNDYFELLRQAVRQASGHVNRNGDYLVFDGVTGLPSLPTCGDLTPWTRQGVLLLNTALTVRRGEPGSHCDIWQPFTDEVIRAVCDSVRVVHFILWGTKAKATFERTINKLHTFALSDHPEREQLIAHDIQRAGLITKNITATYSSHPSPKSVNLGFFGSRPFSRANLALTLNNPGCTPVDWRLS